MINTEQFQKTNFDTIGIYRGLVENNADPLDSGRVQVRILGIHEFDGNILPVENLPWATAAAALSWSGGYNIKNKNLLQSDDPKKSQTEGRYNPGPLTSVLETPGKKISDIKEKNTDNFSDETIDKYANACGTGGNLVVPKNGNWVYLFFEGNNHEFPVYFAMAPNQRDWQTHKSHRNSEIQAKELQIASFRREFEPRLPALAVSSDPNSWAKFAAVNPQVSAPDLSVLAPQTEGEPDNTNRDVQCLTSANGTTIIIDNQDGKEQIFLIHKNYMEYTDKWGNRKLYVGKKRADSGVPDSDAIAEDPDIPCDYQIGVEGNHELHVFGNYDVYAKGRLHIQADSTIQIDAKSHVGLVVRDGDVDMILEKGNVNAHVSGNVNANIKNSANIKVEKNVNLQVGGNVKAEVKGNIEGFIGGNVKTTVGGNVDIMAKVAKITCPDIQVTGNIKISGNVDIVGNVKIGGILNTVGVASFGNVVTVVGGINCGGTFMNSGPCLIGSPVIAYGLIVSPGSGPGFGITPPPPSPASPASPATPIGPLPPMSDIRGIANQPKTFAVMPNTRLNPPI
jgi:hypothetical protein